MPEEEETSLFDDFGGYYSVRIDRVEIAKFAPSHEWTAFWNNNARTNWSFVWVAK